MRGHPERSEKTPNEHGVESSSFLGAQRGTPCPVGADPASFLGAKRGTPSGNSERYSPDPSPRTHPSSGVLAGFTAHHGLPARRQTPFVDSPSGAHGNPPLELQPKHRPVRPRRLIETRNACDVLVCVTHLRRERHVRMTAPKPPGLHTIHHCARDGVPDPRKKQKRLRRLTTLPVRLCASCAAQAREAIRARASGPRRARSEHSPPRRRESTPLAWRFGRCAALRLARRRIAERECPTETRRANPAEAPRERCRSGASRVMNVSAWRSRRPSESRAARQSPRCCHR